MAKAVPPKAGPTNISLSGTPSGTSRLLSYSDLGRHAFGQEYLGAWLKYWRTTVGVPNVLLRGDSTILGTGAVNVNYYPSALLTAFALAKGMKINAVNLGVGGKSTADWLNTYIPADLAAYTGANIPPLYISNFGMNDPYPGIDITPIQTVANLRACFALLRATWTADQTSIAFLMPNTASDDAGNRNEVWREKVVGGIKQACRDYGVAFIDSYAMLREARGGLISTWIDVNHVHPEDEFYLLIWDAVADFLMPLGLRVARSTPVKVTPGAGFTLPGNNEDMASYLDGQNVYINGYVTGPGTTKLNGSTIATVSVPHKPTQAGAASAVWWADILIYNGSFERVRGIVSSAGAITLGQDTTLTVSRAYLKCSWPCS